MNSKLTAMAVLAATMGGGFDPFGSRLDTEVLQISDLKMVKAGAPGSMDPGKRQRRKDSKAKTRKSKNKKGYR